jgi:AraC family transcriptional regulator, regulatory protein of adaptative response / methylated-DNA-[protein]-cysteine methyltransferase
VTQDQNILRELRTITEDVCWQAVEARDARFDGIFVYGVRSTGVYCKPSCPSRRPRRPRVEFFPSCEEAEAAGFRACLRCRPRDVPGPDPRAEMVMRVCRSIEGRDGGGPSLEELGAELGVSPHHLQRTFKRLTGITPRQYAAALRLRRFKSRVKEGDDVTAAMYDAGYGSSSRLYEQASGQLGMTPATYRRKGEGMNISYAVADCYLGRLLVAATDRGVCSVQFGESDEELRAALAEEYPAADIRRDDARLGPAVESLLRHLGGAQPDLKLPLDLQATAFQTRVWEELRRIPYGATRSYGEIAEAVGRPSATRAVARACATNPVALVTPCHRVVRSGGALGGYRWGVRRKKELLRRERRGESAAPGGRETDGRLQLEGSIQE